MKKLVIAALGTTLLTACATTQPPASMNDLNQRMQSLNREADVKEYAPIELNQTEEIVEETSRVWANEGSGDAYSHQLYLANRHIDTTMLLAQKRKLLKEIENAREQQSEILHSLREQQAASAEQKASTTQEKLALLQRKLKDVQTSSTDRGIVLTLDGVLFEFDNARLNPGGKRTIRRLAEFLGKHPETRIAVEGHTDSLGDQHYNMALSQRRAQEVVDALQQQGIALERIQVRAYGEKYPVASNNTEAGRQQNRRVEVVLSKDNESVNERNAPPVQSAY